MKAEFELSIDDSGRPCIKLRHYDKNGSLDQKVLGEFIGLAQKEGLTLVGINGFLKSRTDESWENYEIQIKKTE